MSNEIEIWKDIVGFEGLYQVSSFGRFRNLDRIVPSKNNSMALKKGKLIKPIVLNGRVFVSMKKPGLPARMHMAKRLVACAFHGFKSLNTKIRHLDGDEMNNHSSNIEWIGNGWLSQSELDKMIFMYESGNYNRVDFEEIFNISYPTVRKILESNGQKMNRRIPRNRKHFFNEHYFENIDTRSKAYILGFLFADGNMHQNLYTSSVGVADVDEDLIFFIQSELDLTAGVYRKVGKINKLSGNKEQDSIHLNMNSRIFCEHLLKNGIHPKKSLTLTPPTTVPAEFLNSFVLGYFDGDGCISVSKNKQFGITIVGTESMMKFIQGLICDGSGVNPGKISITNHKKKNPIYRIEWRGRVNCAKIGRYMYELAPFSLKRKKIKFDAAISGGFESLSYKGMFGYDATQTKTNCCHKQG